MYYDSATVLCRIAFLYFQVPDTFTSVLTPAPIKMNLQFVKNPATGDR
jgi:hypothetical protein